VLYELVHVERAESEQVVEFFLLLRIKGMAEKDLFVLRNCTKIHGVFSLNQKVEDNKEKLKEISKEWMESALINKL
jgi:hypothetical protein